MKEAIRHFPLSGKPVSFRPIGMGHIHRTWAVETDSGERYVLQRLNTDVFSAPEQIMDNLARVAEALKKEPAAPYFLRFLDCREGGKLYRGEDHSVWRCYPFVPNSLALDQSGDAAKICQGALAFGRFLWALRALSAETLYETIPNFHHTPERYRQFRLSLSADPFGRREQAEEEIAFVLRREERASILQLLRERGALPLRVTHNDAKLSNVLVDADTGNALCVIDLDTVMPGLTAFDFGDLVRSGCAAAAEDEPKSSRIVLDLERFRWICRGFLQGFPDLTRAERDSLPLGAWTMTLECGLRFLTDYLNGDVYFATDRPAQNLVRARNQFLLCAEIERRWQEMKAVLDEESVNIT